MCRFVYAAFLLLVYIASGKAGAGELPADIHPWDVCEFKMTAERELSSPYVDGLPEGRQFNITGFWDGGKTWRVCFALPAPGEWSYRSSSLDSGLDGKTGRFRCTARTDVERQANATRRGFVRVFGRPQVWTPL